MLFPALVTRAGDADTDCSFTCTVKDLAGVELDTGLTPQCGRVPWRLHAKELRPISIAQALADKMKLSPQQIQKACKIGECAPK